MDLILAFPVSSWHRQRWLPVRVSECHDRHRIIYVPRFARIVRASVLEESEKTTLGRAPSDRNPDRFPGDLPQLSRP